MTKHTMSAGTPLHTHAYETRDILTMLQGIKTSSRTPVYLLLMIWVVVLLAL